MTSTVDPAHDLEVPGLAVRPARAADAPAIAELIRTPADLSQVSPDEEFPLTADTVRHWIQKRRAGYVLEQRARILGYAELVDDAQVSGRVWVGHMMVASGQRGLGLGRRLVAALLRVAESDREAREVAISAFADNERALRCYRGCGFRDRASHRVKDRSLIEMRYRVPGGRPLVPLPVAGASLTMAALLALLVAGRIDWSILVAIPTTLLGLVSAWAFHWILPARRVRGAARIARIAGYAAAVGAVVLVVFVLLGLATDVDVPRVIALVSGAVAVATVAMLLFARRTPTSG